MYNIETSLPSITPKAMYGLNTFVKNNIIYASETKIGHPCSSVIVLDDIATKTQSFLNVGQSPNTMDRMAISFDRNYLAIAESGERPRISIFSLEALKRKKLLGIPFKDLKARDFVGLEFTCNGLYLLAVLGAPEFEMIQYEWEKGKVINRVVASPKKSPITGLSVNPFDPDQIALVGCGLYKMMNYIEGQWKPVGSHRTEHVYFTSVCWLNNRQVAAGSNDGRIVVIESTDIRGIYRALTLFEFSNPPISQAERATMIPVVINTLNVPDEDKTGEHALRNMISFKNGFAFSCEPGIITIFQQINKWSFRKVNVFDVNKCISRSASFAGQCNSINTIAFSPSGEHMTVTTDMNELYVGKVFQEQDFSQDPKLKLEVYEHGYHNGAISHLTLARWKPLAMTLGSTDKSVRLWNYETKKLIMCLDFSSEVYSACIHPTGLQCLIAFADCIKLHLIVVSGLDEIFTVKLASSPFCIFSSNGHQFGAVSSDYRVIYVYHTLDCQLVYVLKGHVGPITRIKWTQDDQFLWSVGGEGSIYKWDLRSGSRIVDVFTAGVGHLDVSITHDGSAAYVSGTDGKLREILDGEVKREIDVKHKILFCVEMAHSGCMLFVAGEKASIVAIQYPLMYSNPTAEFLFHKKPISLMRLSFHDKVLLSISSEGTMCFWDVHYGEIPKIETNYVRQMMVPIEEILKRDKAVDDAVNRMHFLLSDCSVKMHEARQRFEKDLDSVIRIKDRKIQELEKRLSMIENDCTAEMSRVKADLNKKNELCEEELRKTEESLSKRLLKQAQNVMMLEEELMSKTLDFHKTREKLEDDSKRHLTQAEDKVKLAMERCSKLINILLMKKVSDSKREEELRRFIEEDGDKEISQMRVEFESMVKEEENRNFVLQCQNDKLRRTMISLSRDLDVQKANVDILLQENKKLKSYVRLLTKKVETLNQEVQEQVTTVSELEAKTARYEREQVNYMKEKIVSAHVTEQVRSQVEPLENIVFNYTQENAELNDEIKRLRKNLLVHKYEIDRYRLMNVCSKKEYKKLTFQCRKMMTRYRSLEEDIYNISRYVGDPKQFSNAFQLLMRKHITQEKEIDIIESMESKKKGFDYKALLVSEPKKPKPPVLPDYTQKLLKENRTLLKEVNKFRRLNEKLINKCERPLSSTLDTENLKKELEDEEGKDGVEEVIDEYATEEYMEVRQFKGEQKKPGMKVPKLMVTFERDLESDTEEEEEEETAAAVEAEEIERFLGEEDLDDEILEMEEDTEKMVKEILDMMLETIPKEKIFEGQDFVSQSAHDLAREILENIIDQAFKRRRSSETSRKAKTALKKMYREAECFVEDFEEYLARIQKESASYEIQPEDDLKKFIQFQKGGFDVIKWWSDECKKGEDKEKLVSVEDALRERLTAIVKRMKENMKSVIMCSSVETIKKLPSGGELVNFHKK